MSIDIQWCPVLTPTIKEFENFKQYVTKIEHKYRDQYGMVKIIPPKQWTSKCENYQKILKTLRIQKPQFQTLYGRKKDFFYSCRNKPRAPMSLRQYKKYAQKKQLQIEGIKRHEDIEDKFWSICTQLYQQLYGANVQVSLMDGSSKQWEFQKLKSFFSEVVKEKIHGLNTSFLFIGAWRTFFNWHIQDLDLSAINILHQGAPKVWYGIHPKDRKRFEGILSTYFQEEFTKCKNYMRHKQIFLNPYKLKEKFPSLRISKMYQGQRQISIAFAEGYHSGFNMGFNIAEAVNFGLEEWLQRYSHFRKCSCPLQIGVTLQHKQMLQNMKQSKNFKQISQSKGYLDFLKIIKEEQNSQKSFEQATEQQIEEEIKKAKTKLINKNKSLIYVTKYRRFFPQETQMQIQCNNCHLWRKVPKKKLFICKQKTFKCSQLEYTCQQKRKVNKKK